MSDEPNIDIESDAPLRMYFLPPGVNYDELATELRLALLEIVLPCYREYVLFAPGALERSAGVSLTYLLTLEILEQFGLSSGLDLKQLEPGDRQQRTQQIAQYLRLVGSKQRVASFLAKLQAVRRNADPLTAS